MAMESEDSKAIVLAIKQILNNCCVTEIDVESLPILDFEYFFLHLRARSVGEIIDLEYKCNNDVKEEEGKTSKCGNKIKFSFNALEVEPDLSDAPNNKIQLTPKLGVCMKYPEFRSLEDVGEEKVAVSEFVAKTVSASIDYIYDEENIYYAKDATQEELIDFIDSLTREQFALIQDFFEKIPKLKKKLDFKCTKCGYNEEVEIAGIQSFFV